jgi:hypothetical protein
MKKVLQNILPGLRHRVSQHRLDHGLLTALVNRLRLHLRADGGRPRQAELKHFVAKLLGLLVKGFILWSHVIEYLLFVASQRH